MLLTFFYNALRKIASHTWMRFVRAFKFVLSLNSKRDFFFRNKAIYSSALFFSISCRVVHCLFRPKPFTSNRPNKMIYFFPLFGSWWNFYVHLALYYARLRLVYTDFLRKNFHSWIPVKLWKEEVYYDLNIILSKKPIVEII